MKRVEISLAIAAVLASMMIGTAVFASPVVQGQTSTVNPDSVSAMTDTTALRQITIAYRGQELGAVALDRLGDLEYQRDAFSSAKQEFLQTTSQYLGFPTEVADANYWLGKIAIHDNEPSVAENYLSSFLSVSPTGAKAEWARYYLTREKYRDGKSDYLAATQYYFAQPHSVTASHDFNIQYDLVRYLINRHKYGSALAAADTFMARYPTNASAIKVRFETAIIHELMGQSSDAVQIYRKIISNAASKRIAAHAQFELATAYQGQGEYKQAVSEFNKIPVVYPNQAEYVDATQYALAMIKYSESLATPDSGQLGEKAFDALQQFVSNHPTNSHTPRALMALADLYNKRGDYQSACAAYQKIIGFDTLYVALNPKAMARSNDLRAHRRLVRKARIAEGDVLMSKLHDDKDALSAFQGVLMTDGSSHEARLKEAMCYERLGRKSEASAVLDSLVQAGGTDAGAAKFLLKSIASDTTAEGGR